MEDDILVFCLALGSERAAEELGLKINSIPFILSPRFKLCDFIKNCLSTSLKLLNEHELCFLLNLNPKYYSVLMNVCKKPIIGETKPKRKRKRKKKPKQANVDNKRPVIGIIECSVCSKVFKNTTFLKIHMRIHTGDKPYSCSLCDYKSTQKSNLNTHQRLRHKKMISKDKNNNH